MASRARNSALSRRPALRAAEISCIEGFPEVGRGGSCARAPRGESDGPVCRRGRLRVRSVLTQPEGRRVGQAVPPAEIGTRHTSAGWVRRSGRATLTREYVVTGAGIPATGGFGERLRGLRRGAGLGQEELAHVAGVSVRMLSDLERERCRGPRRRTVQALATALGLDAVGAEELERIARPGRLRLRPTAGRAEAEPAPHHTLAALDTRNQSTWQNITIVAIGFTVTVAAAFTGYYKYRERSYFLLQTADAIEEEANAFTLGVGPLQRLRRGHQNVYDIALAGG
ncbi:helix-turn-helix domain-containing protein [Streptomyces sp. QH1-20]|uniref:helix-turn-helix domain-containing protein n=1 Tax=Streptomyces sp. QH1-20 TaxID=3240934 RepID=UPI003512D4DA